MAAASEAAQEQEDEGDTGVAATVQLKVEDQQGSEVEEPTGELLDDATVEAPEAEVAASEVPASPEPPDGDTVEAPGDVALPAESLVNNPATSVAFAEVASPPSDRQEPADPNIAGGADQASGRDPDVYKARARMPVSEFGSRGDRLRMHAEVIKRLRVILNYEFPDAVSRCTQWAEELRRTSSEPLLRGPGLRQPAAAPHEQLDAGKAVATGFGVPRPKRGSRGGGSRPGSASRSRAQPLSDAGARLPRSPLPPIAQHDLWLRGGALGGSPARRPGGEALGPLPPLGSPSPARPPPVWRGGGPRF